MSLAVPHERKSRMHDRVRKYFRSTADPALLEENGRKDELTSREREVLSLIAEGRANKEIAAKLAISIRTVEAHRARIMRKLDIRSHAGLIYFAMRSNGANTP